MFLQNSLKKGHQTHEKKHEKSDFVQSTTYKKLCKKSKIIDTFKNAFKKASKCLLLRTSMPI